MCKTKMKRGIMYIVTKGSDDGTFVVGDCIVLKDDGSICCIEAHGWIDAGDVPMATEGMCCEVDEKWRKNELEKLEKMLNRLR